MPYVVVLTSLIIASITDIRFRLIPNSVSYSLFIGGLFYRLIYPEQVIGHLGVIFLFFVFYFIKFWAPGDVKLLVGISLWVPLFYLPWFFLFYASISFLYRMSIKSFKKPLPAAPIITVSFSCVFALLNIFPMAGEIFMFFG